MTDAFHAMDEAHNAPAVRRKAVVRGVVQGVGFRPFVYRVAHEEQLAGFIGNDTDGVTIEVEGSTERVEGFINAAANARIATDINTVALSGGCMHNRRLARLLRVGLEEEGFQVFMHRQVSPGDGGLSYGQAAVAAARLSARS